MLAIGPDTHIDTQGRMAFLNVHLESSKADNRTKQLNKLTAACTLLQTSCDIVIIGGDFNTEPRQKDLTTIEFFSKDDPTVLLHEFTVPGAIAIQLHRPQVHTTKKVRHHTTQFAKMHQHVEATIDAFIVVFFTEDAMGQLAAPTTDSTLAMIADGHVVQPDEVISTDIWPSDHAMVYSLPLHTFTWNMGGESGNNKHNMHEFMPLFISKKFFDRGDPRFRNAVDQIMEAFPDVNGMTFSYLRTQKIIGQATRGEPIFDTHYHESLKDLYDPEDYAHYEATLAAYRASEGEHRVYGDAVLELWNQFYTHPVLAPMYREWVEHLRTTRRPTVTSVLWQMLAMSPRAIFLQEVNKDMLAQLVGFFAEGSTNYRLSFDPDTADQKTRGVLILPAEHVTSTAEQSCC